jgi:hypothetical protein
MKEFFLKMLNSNDPTNSKVFEGLVSLLLIVVVTIVSFFKPVQMEVYYSLLTFCAGLFGLSTLPFKKSSD